MTDPAADLRKILDVVLEYLPPNSPLSQADALETIGAIAMRYPIGVHEAGSVLGRLNRIREAYEAWRAGTLLEGDAMSRAIEQVDPGPASWQHK